jgi:hypothetical protein
VERVGEHRALALEQARYEAGHVRRQYDAVDPDNRQVTAELERRWNASLVIVAQREAELAAAAAEQEETTAGANRDQLPALRLTNQAVSARIAHPGAANQSAARPGYDRGD